MGPRFINGSPVKAGSVEHKIQLQNQLDEDKYQKQVEKYKEIMEKIS